MGDKEDFWYKVLKTRYEDVKIRVMIDGGTYRGRNISSAWWKEKIVLDDYAFVNLFSRGCRIRVGNGFDTSFWHAWWMDEGILKDLFPFLLYFSALQDVSIAIMGAWNSNAWIRSDCGIPQNIRSDQQLETMLFSFFFSAATLPAGLCMNRSGFCSDLATSVPSFSATSILVSQHGNIIVGTNKGSWLYDNEGVFSVSSCHRIINAEHIPYGPLDRNNLSFKCIWKMDVPMKVKAFSWRCFINRILTCIALKNRGIISNSSNLYGFGGLLPKLIVHLFLIVVSPLWFGKRWQIG